MVGTVSRPADRNAIGAHGGSYALYRALAVVVGRAQPDRRPDLTNTLPAVEIGPFPQWCEPGKIVSLDPWGHRVAEDFAPEIAEGVDIRPTIAITKARLDLPEMNERRRGRPAQGRRHDHAGQRRRRGDQGRGRSGLVSARHRASASASTETQLRRTLFEQTGGMYPGAGDAAGPAGVPAADRRHHALHLRRRRPSSATAARSPAACTTSATARTCSAPTSAPAGPISSTASRSASRRRRTAALGLIVYNRKEGRALGEVTKFLVYNARKRQEGGDQAATYFERTECVAGVQDARFQQLMPDVLHWLGITRIDRFVSMSNMKYDALTAQGIEIGERVPIPDELIPDDAQVEMEAKKAAGYFAPRAADRGRPEGDGRPRPDKN